MKSDNLSGVTRCGKTQKRGQCLATPPSQNIKHLEKKLSVTLFKYQTCILMLSGTRCSSIRMLVYFGQTEVVTSVYHKVLVLV